MQVTVVDGFYEASYITGPKHVTLQLIVGTGNVPSIPAIEPLAARGGCWHGELSQQQIVAGVQEGVARANSELHTAYSSVAIRYPIDDTPTYIVYQLLAYHIVLFHHRS